MNNLALAILPVLVAQICEGWREHRREKRAAQVSQNDRLGGIEEKLASLGSRLDEVATAMEAKK